MLQVSAAISPVTRAVRRSNSAGQVIGMTTAGQTSGNPGQETGSTTGFAIPINKAMAIISEIRAGSGTNIHIGNAALLGVAVSRPSQVSTAARPTARPRRPRAEPGSAGVTANPAASAGVTVCGRITGIGGTTIANTSISTPRWRDSRWADRDPHLDGRRRPSSHSATVTLGQAPFPD